MASPKQQFLAELRSGKHRSYAHYSPDYAWRIYRGEQRGLSRSQARGHARIKKGETPVSVLNYRLREPVFSSYATGTAWLSYPAGTWDEVEFILRNADRGNATRVFVDVNMTLRDGSQTSARTRAVSIRNRSVESIARQLQSFALNMLNKYERKPNARISYDVHFAGRVE